MCRLKKRRCDGAKPSRNPFYGPVAFCCSSGLTDFTLTLLTAHSLWGVQAKGTPRSMLLQTRGHASASWQVCSIFLFGACRGLILQQTPATSKRTNRVKTTKFRFTVATATEYRYARVLSRTTSALACFWTREQWPY